MQKAIFSRIDLNNADNDLAQEYLSCIRDLLHLHDVQDLKAFTQHMNTSRFQHSLNVSYYTFLIARRFHLDSCSAKQRRAGFCRLLINTAPSAKFFCRVEEECDIPDLLFHWLHCFPSAFDSTYIQIMLCLGFISGHSFFLLSNEHAA